HRSARFIEYLVPTLLVLAALMDKATATTDYLWKKKLALPLIIVALLHGLYMSSLGAERRKLLTNPPTKPHYLEAGRYLNDQLGDGDIIYTPRWAAAARLFYHNQNKRFIFFLDPFFMYQNDEKRFNLFQTTNLGMQEDPLAIIQNDFNASAIFFPAEDTVFTQNKKLFEQLRAELGEPWRSPEGDAVFILKQ
ncbi:MAG: hypothetical protein MK193_01350, partial [Lentisphaeria bacterium]|nr:hypothetical protein [Lentisphaeria bacterium]